MAYADVLVTAEVNIIAGLYVGCVGCNTVGSQVPACISSVAYFFQLAYVYSIGISNTCCYAGNLAACYIQATADGCSVFAKHDGFCTIISTDIAHANTAVSNCKVFITIGNDDAIFIQVNFGISIGNRGNISQIACNINLVISLAVFNCRFNCCILTVRQGSMFTCFCFYIFQLTIVYCISIGSTCCYTGNLATFFNDNIINLNLAAICKANATCTFTCADDGFDILQLIVQLYFYFSAVMAYADVLVTAEVNIIAGLYVGCVGCNTVGSQVPACISSVAYLLQLCYVYCVSIFSTCCYVGNLASYAVTTHRYSTFSSLPGCIRLTVSTIAKRACSCACYAAYAQSNAAFYAYACTIANSNCIISRNRILMTEGNNIAYASNCVFVAHYNRIGNISQFIVRTCHEYVMATLFIITGKFVIIADNGRIGLFGNIVGTADYCNSTAFLFSKNRIVTTKNSESIQ